jgi:hypothetical protein
VRIHYLWWKYAGSDGRRKYRYMDANLQQRRRGLADKIPDIRSTLAMVTFLEERRVRSRIPFSYKC